MGGLRGLFTAIFGGVASALFYLTATRGGLGAAILVAMSPLPLFVVGLSQGSRFLVLAAMIAAGICSNLGGQTAAAQFLLAMVLPALVLVPVALASAGFPSRFLSGRSWPWRKKIADADGTPLQSAAAVEEEKAPAASVGAKAKGWLTKPAFTRPVRLADRMGKECLDGARLILALVVLGLVAFVALIVGAHGIAALQAMQAKAAADSLRQIQGLLPADVSAALAKAPIKAFSAVLPSLGVVLWLLTTAMNGVLAQGALSSFGWNLRSAPAMAALAIPRWAGLVFALALAIAVLGHGVIGFVGLNVTVILGVALVFEGLAVLHSLAARSPAPGVFLVMAYLVGFVLGWPILLVAILGLSDQLLDLRGRLASNARRGEK